MYQYVYVFLCFIYPFEVLKKSYRKGLSFKILFGEKYMEEICRDVSANWPGLHYLRMEIRESYNMIFFLMEHYLFFFRKFLHPVKHGYEQSKYIHNLLL